MYLQTDYFLQYRTTHQGCITYCQLRGSFCHMLT